MFNPFWPKVLYKICVSILTLHKCYTFVKQHTYRGRTCIKIDVCLFSFPKELFAEIGKLECTKHRIGTEVGNCKTQIKRYQHKHTNTQTDTHGLKD